MAKAEVKQGIVGKGTGFFHDCMDELKKVSKPTRQETIQATIVTIILMLFIAVALGLMDVVFYNLMSALLMVREGI
jgi:preprotein translocase SecE subunit